MEISAISAFVRAPRSDGTLYGVPFAYRTMTCEYVLPDGSAFADWDDVVGYVTHNLDALKSVVANKVQAITAKELNRRTLISNENKKRQLAWDKEFNRKVVELVRKAIDQGGVSLRVAHLPPVPQIVEPSSEVAVEKIDYEVFHVRYDSFLPEPVAYARCREQAENAVRNSMKPPDLIPVA